MWRQVYYKAAVDSVDDAVIVVDEDAMIQSVNASTERIFDSKADHLIGNNLSTLIQPHLQSGLDSAHVAKRLAVLGLDLSPMLGRRCDGTLFPIELAATSWIGLDSRRYVTVTIHDVSTKRAAAAALQDSQEWLRTVSDTALVGLVVVGRDYNIRFANRAFAVLFNLVSHDIVDFAIADVLPAMYNFGAGHLLDTAFSGTRTTQGCVFPPDTEPAQQRHLSLTYEPSRNAAGEQVVVVVVTDVTELTRNEAALRASRDLLQSVLDGAHDAIFAKDARGRYVAVNESCMRIIGRPREAIIGRTDKEIWGEDVARPYVEADRLVMESGVLSVSEASIVVDGDTRHYLVTKRPWQTNDRRARGVVGISHDITEQRQLQAEREKIAKRLMQAQEAERLRIARELHDQVGQNLTGLSLGLKALEGHILDGEPLSRLAWLRELTDRISRDLHRTALELRPTSIEDLGLREAITSHIGDISMRSGLQVDFHLDDLDGCALSAEARLAVYRAIQEAMTNVLKHANASTASVVAQRLADRLRVVVEDNGRGFTSEEPAPRIGGDCLGLLGMQERLGLVDGSLSIESVPGHGTSIFISVPIGEALDDSGVSNA